MVIDNRKCLLNFGCKFWMEFDVLIDEGILCELVFLLEDEEEVIFKELAELLQDARGIFDHLFEIVLVMVQKLDETLIAQTVHFVLPLAYLGGYLVCCMLVVFQVAYQLLQFPVASPFPRLALVHHAELLNCFFVLHLGPFALVVAKVCSQGTHILCDNGERVLAYCEPVGDFVIPILPLLESSDFAGHECNLLPFGLAGQHSKEVVVVDGGDLVFVPGAVERGDEGGLRAVRAISPHFIVNRHINRIDCIFSNSAMSEKEFPFQTITLQASASTPNPLLPGVKVQQYHHLLKMKKVLADTQLKMENRINLFKKASSKILKQQENNYRVFSKIEAIREQSPFIKRAHTRTRYDLRPLSHNRNTPKEPQSAPEEPSVADKLHQQRILNARSLKEEKSRLKVVVQEQKKMDLERKLVSANGVRRCKHNAKQARENLESERREQLQRELGQKYAREREQFLGIQKHLNQLQAQEEEALISWKRTLKDHV